MDIDRRVQYKSVLRQHIVKTSGTVLKKFIWNESEKRSMLFCFIMALML